ncbi:MAG: clostripain-related cysteine peptidase [Candidatus Thorarchaeota archaeon]
MKQKALIVVALLLGLFFQPILPIVFNTALPTPIESNIQGRTEKLDILINDIENQQSSDSDPFVNSSGIIPTQIASSLSPMQTSDWTVIVYLAADNDLEEPAFDDFNAMETVGSTANVKIIVGVDFWQGDYAPYTGGKIYELNLDVNPDTIGSTEIGSWVTDPNMGDPSVLENFITFAQGYAPANNYLLVLWDHGGGFYGVCFDETNGNDRLTSPEIHTTLNNVGNIDVIAFDACLMGQLEVAYEIRNDVDYIVFSEEGIPLTGFPYEDILSYLTANPSTLPAEVANQIVSAYSTAYDVGGRYYDASVNDICISSISSIELNSVANALDDLVDYFASSSTQLEAYYEYICQVRGNTQSFDWPDFMDLGSFAEEIIALSIDSTLISYATALQSAVTAAVEAEAHLSGLPDATGLGLAFSTHGSYSLDLLSATSYESFMTSFCAIGSSTSSYLEIDGIGIHYGYLDSEGDSVYYQFTPTSSGMTTIRLSSMQVYDEDFDLYVYDEGWNEIASSLGYDSEEQVAVNLVANSIYYIEVYSYTSGYSEGLGSFTLIFQGAGGLFPIPPMMLLILAFSILVIITIIVIITMMKRRRRITELPEERTYSYVDPRYRAPESEATPFRADTVQKICNRCGATNPSSAAFCAYCGSRIG